MDENKDIKIVPVQPGFRFQCQNCGKCCKEKIFALSSSEGQMFSNLDLDVGYTVSIGAETKEILSIRPAKPKNCRAYIDGKCGMYSGRPAGCKIYPFVARMYHDTPPSIENVLNSLRLDKAALHTTRIKPFIHAIDSKRYLFLGAEVQEGFCPGIGSGAPYKEIDITRLIRSMLYDIEMVTGLDTESSNSIIDQLKLKTESDLAQYFVLDQVTYHDDIMIIVLYKPVHGKIKGFGDIVLDKAIRDTIIMDKPLK